MDKNKIKVCMLTHNPPFQGGIVQYCVLLANQLKNKVNLNIVGFDKLYPPFLYKGKLPSKSGNGLHFETKYTNFIKWYNPFTWIKTYNIMKKADIMFLHWVSPLLAPLQYTILKLNSVFRKKKVILTCHNIEPHESTIFDRIFTKKVFSLVDHFIVHAEQNKLRLIKEYRKNPNKIHVVPHGTFDFFTKWRKKNKKELKKEFNLNENEKIILFFGYIREYKGLKYLLKSMHEVIKEDKNIRLIIAGELWQNMEVYEKELNGLENFVKFFPKFIPNQEVYKFFDVADICVLPYHNTEQTISGPLLVALAFGKPTIISPVGGIREFIKDGQEAIFSQGGDVKLLSENIIKLIKDKNLQDKLSKNAIKKNSTFGWDKVTSKYYEIMKNIRV
ncbi:hypothetical protein CEE44_02355 [Candidatus Woesearchaeota archaeon B3_Woes]|nr:MAG: hypothetical protein CEE44_02355 [Candidatus Woesearchaeota archaeon B3_Woes]